MSDSETDEVFIEYIQIKKTVRVTAIDAATGTEVTFQAPVSTSRSELERLAMKKLNYVMNKQEKDR